MWLSKEDQLNVLTIVGIQVIMYREFLKEFDGDEELALKHTEILLRASMQQRRPYDE